MKKLFFVSILAIGVLLTGCKGDPEDLVNKYDKYPYSQLTPEQQKEKLAGESDAILNKMRDLNKQEGRNLFKVFQELLDEGEPDINLIVDFNKNQFKVNDFSGEYSWNATKRSWDFKAGKGGTIVFNFPSTINGTQNDAKAVLTGDGSGNIENFDGVKVELPKKIKTVLSKSGKTVASIETSVKNPNLENYAKSSELKITYGDYKIEIKADQDKNAVFYSKFKFSKGKDNILEATLFASIEEVNLQGFEVKIGSNLAITGFVDIMKFVSSDSPEEANKYAKLTLVSTKDKCKIADVKITGDGYMLVFNDNTEIAANVFFGEGFDDAMNAWSDFLNSFFE